MEKSVWRLVCRWVTTSISSLEAWTSFGWCQRAGWPHSQARSRITRSCSSLRWAWRMPFFRAQTLKPRRAMQGTQSKAANSFEWCPVFILCAANWGDMCTSLCNVSFLESKINAGVLMWGWLCLGMDGESCYWLAFLVRSAWKVCWQFRG